MSTHIETKIPLRYALNADNVRQLSINIHELDKFIKLPKAVTGRLLTSLHFPLRKKYLANPLRREIEKLIDTGDYSTKEEIANYLGLSRSYVSRVLKRGE